MLKLTNLILIYSMGFRKLVFLDVCLIVVRCFMYFHVVVCLQFYVGDYVSSACTIVLFICWSCLETYFHYHTYERTCHSNVWMNTLFTTCLCLYPMSITYSIVSFITFVWLLFCFYTQSNV